MKLFFLLTTILIHFSANAQNVILRDPILSGNGCPRGSVSAILDPNSKAISILFDSMIVNQASTDPIVPVIDLNCTVKIPVSVEKGWNLDATRMIVRGVLVNTSPAAIAYTRLTAQLNNALGYVVPPEVFGVKTGLIDQDITINALVRPNVRAFCRPERELTFTLSTGYTHRRDRFGNFIGVRPFDFYSAIDSADVGGTPVEINYQISRCN